MFTRRHYCAIACVISEAGLEPKALDRLVRDFVVLFVNDNDRFDQVRFRAACSELNERDRLEARGYRDGYAAATRFAPEHERTARWILDGLDAGDPEVLGYLPSPRLGEE
jgi:hypothetical protein